MAGVGGYIGRVGESESAKENFTSYCERMDLFFLANGLMEDGGDAQKKKALEEKQKAIFLTEVGASVYSILVNLLSPVSPKDTTLPEITKTLKQHFDPAPLEIAESYKFGTRDRRKDESVSDYVVALKKLSIHCNFGQFLTWALRERQVCDRFESRKNTNQVNEYHRFNI